MADNESKKSIAAHKKAVAEEISLLSGDDVIKDHNILHEISRLKNLYNELSAKETQNKKTGGKGNV